MLLYMWCSGCGGSAAAGVHVDEAAAGWTVRSWTAEELLEKAAPRSQTRSRIRHGRSYGCDAPACRCAFPDTPATLPLLRRLTTVSRTPAAGCRCVAGPAQCTVHYRMPIRDKCRRSVQELLSNGVSGFRITPTEHGKPFGRRRTDWLSSDGMAEMWRTGASTRQAMCGLLDVAELPAWEVMVAKYPDTPAVIDHFCRLVHVGAPGRRNPRSVPTCEIPNVYVKLSAFYALGNATPPYDDMLPFVAKLRDAFGARRLMWGSDSPYQEHQHFPPFNQNAQSNQTCKFEPRQRLIVVHLACVIWSMIATDARAWLLCNYAGGGSVLLARRRAVNLRDT